MTTENTRETMKTEGDKVVKFQCCFCGEIFGGFGYNPWPAQEEGRCCAACYAKIALPARIRETVTKEEPRKDRAFKCCICGLWAGGKEFGENPWPVREEGDSCSYCNMHVVLPARLERCEKKTE